MRFYRSFLDELLKEENNEKENGSSSGSWNRDSDGEEEEVDITKAIPILQQFCTDDLSPKQLKSIFQLSHSEPNDFRFTAFIVFDFRIRRLWDNPNVDLWQSFVVWPLSITITLNFYLLCLSLILISDIDCRETRRKRWEMSLLEMNFLLRQIGGCWSEWGNVEESERGNVEESERGAREKGWR